MNVKVETSTLQEKQLQLESETQVDVSLSQLTDAKAAVDVSLKQIEIAKKELEFSQKKMSSGSAGGLDVSNAQVNMANALDVNVQAVFSYEVAKVNYFRAVGDFDKYFALEEGRQSESRQ
jgi:outer membrane protein TolC